MNEAKALAQPSKEAKADHKTINTLAYVIGVVGNFAVIPQIIKAWQGPAPGLAVLTWLMFIGFGVIWLVYAVVHKQKPLIFAQIVGLSCNTLVVIGWVIHNLI
jgi:uncharacterized protein with PQ loop repeat